MAPGDGVTAPGQIPSAVVSNASRAGDGGAFALPDEMVNEVGW
jgi:hypothetical protein